MPEMSRELEWLQHSIPFSSKHVGYADDICLLSHTAIDFLQMSLDLKKEARNDGLKINSNWVKIYSLTGDLALPICLTGQNFEGVNQYVSNSVSAGTG